MSFRDLVLLYVGPGVVVVVLVVVFVTRQRAARAWRQSVRQAAQKYRLRYTAVESWIVPFLDSASGTFEGVDLSIETDSDIGDTYPETRFMKLEASGGFAAKLVIVERGALRKRSDPTIIDYGTEAPRETRTGHSAFDERVEMYEAAPRLLEAIRGGGLEELIEDLLPDGLRVEYGTVTLRTTALPKTPGDLLGRLDVMIGLCRRLTELQPG
jgi:hypothetical protein